jgi:orotidine-5'-phosphate decarboxylase
MPDSFASRFAVARSQWGPLVWGLDPSGPLLHAWGLDDTADGLDQFADIVLEAAAGTVGLVKPQSAFYERHGWRGTRTLARLLAGARSAGILTILDVKRGDFEPANDAYAEAFLGAGAPLEADAVTVTPYLGLAAMGGFVSRAHKAGACLLVVTRSSNLEGRAIQAIRDEHGRSIEETVLANISGINAAVAPGSIGPVGAVIGAKQLDPPLDLAGANALFLAPGVGAQGAGSADVARTFAECPDRVMPSASRSLLSAGPDVSALRDGVAALADEFRTVLS